MPVAAYGGQSQQRWGDNTVNANEYIRDFILFDTKGEPRATAAARKAGMLVLAFFKTACGTSQMTFPYLQKLADAYAEGGKLTVWGISQDDETTTRAFAEKHGIAFPILLDRDLLHSMTYGIVTVPTLFFADSSGMVLKKVVGWDRAALNAISEQVAAFAEREPVKIVEDNDPAPAVRPG